MSRVREGVYSVLKGRFLTDESSYENWKLLVFVVALLLVMISSSHSLDAKVVEMARLNKEKRELRAEDVDTSIRLMRMELESSIRDKVRYKRLAPAKMPPRKIKVIYNKE